MATCCPGVNAALDISSDIFLSAVARKYKYKYKWEFLERGLQIVQGRLQNARMLCETGEL